jgi:hypothetical protein
MLTSDAKYYFPGSVASGVNEVEELCVNLYAQVPHRHHEMIYAYSFGRNDNEIAEYGSRKYGVESIEEKCGLWMEILRVDGESMIKSKRVFVVIVVDLPG